MKILILTAFVITLTYPLRAQESYKMALNSVVIKGTSNVHKWEEKIGQLNGSATVLIEGEQITGLSEAHFEIPVKSIKSSKGSIMDNKTYQALKAEECSTIMLKLQKGVTSGTELKTTATLTLSLIHI